MRQRFVAGLFLGIWLVLFAVEFGEELKLFECDDLELNQSMDAVLASFGTATPLDDPRHPPETVFSPFTSGIMGWTMDPYLDRSPPFRSLLHGPMLGKANLKIFKLHHTYLI